jgi:hypothetical protein
MKIKRFFSLILACFMVCSSAACSLGDTANVEDTNVAEETTTVVPLATSLTNRKTTNDGMFISDGKTEYIIVYSASVGSVEYQAVSELIDLIYEGVGVTIAAVTDEEVGKFTATDKYISVGENSYSLSAGASVDASEVGSNGFRIQTIGSSVFLLGGGAWGTVWAAYEFLTIQIGYEFYYENSFSFDEERCKNCALEQIDMTDKPDYEWRMAGDAEAANSKSLRTRLRMTEGSDMWAMTGNISYAHNYLAYVPTSLYSQHPDWFNSGLNTLCFSRDPDGLRAYVLEQMKEILTSLPNAYTIGFTQQDSDKWCDCSSCQKVISQYGGANSATQVLFMISLANDLQAWLSTAFPGRTVTLYFFAYWMTFTPPTFSEDLIFPDNLGVIVAPLHANHQYSFYSSVNSSIAANISIWSKFTSNIAAWDYEANFGDYLAPYDAANKLVENIRYFKELGSSIYFNQAEYTTDNRSFFARWRQYIESKLLWNVDEDVNVLTDNFFENYYKDAAEAMRNWYDTYRSWSLLHGYDASAHTQSLLDTYLDYADQAYDAILKYKYTDPDLYEELYERINVETIGPRYLYLKNYRGLLEDPATFAEQLKIDCANLGFSMWSEFATIDSFFSSIGY